MGQLKSDGKAINVVAPAGIIPFGELVRIDGWNGITLGELVAADTERAMALEVSSERIWYVSIPAAVVAPKGTYLYWTAGAGYKTGAADLAAAVVGSPVALVEEAVDANDIAGLRVLNVGP